MSVDPNGLKDAIDVVNNTDPIGEWGSIHLLHQNLMNTLLGDIDIGEKLLFEIDDKTQRAVVVGNEGNGLPGKRISFEMGSEKMSNEKKAYYLLGNAKKIADLLNMPGVLEEIKTSSY